ncbi:MAG TPA: kelch repeat-containing protein, partial [Anaeromyxobacter sp.]|nr:kelch repeat-containing protein [Anaeromyxobacter sp.]
MTGARALHPGRAAVGLALAAALAAALAGCGGRRPEPKPERPLVQLSRSRLSFELDANDVRTLAPPSATVQIVNAGAKPDPAGQPVPRVEYGGAAEWLVVDVRPTEAGWELTVEPERLELVAAGDYLATLRVSWEGASNSPVAAEVALTVHPHFTPWTPGSPTARPTRAGHTATLLPDGDVLVIGGYPIGGARAPDPAVERFGSATGLWADAGRLARRREAHTATLLVDGTVLVAGGGDGWASAGEEPDGTWELYDPRTGTVLDTGPLAAERSSHGAVRLADGRVLLVGGWSEETGVGADTLRCELFDPATRTSREVGALHGSATGATPVLLGDGRVLVTTYDEDGLEVGTEIFDPVTETWTVGASRLHRRAYHATVRLADGEVMVAGGDSFDAARTPQTIYPAAAELWDPDTE